MDLVGAGAVAHGGEQPDVAAGAHLLGEGEEFAGLAVVEGAVEAVGEHGEGLQGRGYFGHGVDGEDTGAGEQDEGEGEVAEFAFAEAADGGSVPGAAAGEDGS